MRLKSPIADYLPITHSDACVPVAHIMQNAYAPLPPVPLPKHVSPSIQSCRVRKTVLPRPSPSQTAAWPRILSGIRKSTLDVAGTPPITSSIAWRLALRDDIYSDKRLQILTRGRAKASAMSSPIMQSTLDDEDLTLLEGPARSLVASIPSASDADLGDLVSNASTYPARLRQNVLIANDNGSPLLYITLWWDSRVYFALDTRKKRNKPDARIVTPLVLPIDLEQARYEHSRQILSVVYGAIDQGTFTWGRQYVYKRRHKPFLVAEEVFAPAIAQYLGEITPPLYTTGIERLTADY